MKTSIFSSLSGKFGSTSLVLQKNAPGILFGVGVVGFVGTVVAASVATLKFSDVIDETKDNLDLAKGMFEREEEKKTEPYDETDYKKDVYYIYRKAIVSTVKLYAPAVALGTMSILALTKSHNILNKRNAGLMAAYAGLDKTFKEYRKRVEEALGEDTETELRYGLKDEEYEEEGDDGKPQTKKRTVITGQPSIYARFFDEGNMNYQKDPGFNRIFLNAQQNYANDFLRHRGYIFLNDVYDMLGMDRTPEGAVVGWIMGSQEGDSFVDFGIFSNPDSLEKRLFVNGDERSVLLDFNVDGVIFDQIDKLKKRK